MTVPGFHCRNVGVGDTGYQGMAGSYPAFNHLLAVASTVQIMYLLHSKVVSCGNVGHPQEIDDLSIGMVSLAMKIAS